MVLDQALRGRKKYTMSNRSWAAIMIILLMSAGGALEIYQSIQIRNLEARHSALEAVFIKQAGEIDKAVLSSVQDKFKAYGDGLHHCQSMCYGRMRSYEMDDREARCVCFGGFTEED